MDIPFARISKLTRKPQYLYWKKFLFLLANIVLSHRPDKKHCFWFSVYRKKSMPSKESDTM